MLPLQCAHLFLATSSNGSVSLHHNIVQLVRDDVTQAEYAHIVPHNPKVLLAVLGVPQWVLGLAP